VTTDPGLSAPLPTLTVGIGRETHTLDPRAGVAVIGRDTAAAVRIADDRISRWHVRLEPRHDGWQAIDTSINGMFVDGVRRSSALITGATTIHLGDPDGIPVTLTPSDPFEATFAFTRGAGMPESDEDEVWEGATDPGVVRAGRAVADRRNELEITQRSLARDKIINAGTLIAFEKGRTWPRRGTLSRLEKVLGWPPGTIMRIRSGAPTTSGVAAVAPGGVPAAHADEATEVFTDTVQAPLMAEAVELAMHTITAAMTDLPDQASPDFTPKATSILADLRKLEKLASSAARNARGTPSVVLALSSVRRSYNDLMMRAARSPAATLGQRLYEARHRAELSLEEAATAAGLPIAILGDAEADRPIPQDAATAVNTLIAQLTMS
jgi:transcriptional regulator with XRE-family HTH domain